MAATHTHTCRQVPQHGSRRPPAFPGVSRVSRSFQGFQGCQGFPGVPTAKGFRSSQEFPGVSRVSRSIHEFPGVSRVSGSFQGFKGFQGFQEFPGVSRSLQEPPGPPGGARPRRSTMQHRAGSWPSTTTAQELEGRKFRWFDVFPAWVCQGHPRAIGSMGWGGFQNFQSNFQSFQHSA